MYLQRLFWMSSRCPCFCLSLSVGRGHVLLGKAHMCLCKHAGGVHTVLNFKALKTVCGTEHLFVTMKGVVLCCENDVGKLKHCDSSVWTYIPLYHSFAIIETFWHQTGNSVGPGSRHTMPALSDFIELSPWLSAPLVPVHFTYRVRQQNRTFISTGTQSYYDLCSTPQTFYLKLKESLKCHGMIHVQKILQNLPVGIWAQKWQVNSPFTNFIHT